MCYVNFYFLLTTTPAFITATGRPRMPVPMLTFKRCIKVWKFLYEKTYCWYNLKTACMIYTSQECTLKTSIIWDNLSLIKNKMFQRLPWKIFRKNSKYIFNICIRLLAPIIIVLLLTQLWSIVYNANYLLRIGASVA